MLARLPSYEGVAAAAPSVDPETRERLQALGYLGGPGPGGAHGPLADPKDMIDIASLVVDANVLLSGGRPAEALEVAQRAAKVLHERRLEHVAKIYRAGPAEGAEDALRALAQQPKAEDRSAGASLIPTAARGGGQASRTMGGPDPRPAGSIARGDLLRGGRKEERAVRRDREVEPTARGGAGVGFAAHRGPPSARGCDDGGSEAYCGQRTRRN